MAYPNKTIVNSVTGQSIRFLKTRNDTAGELLGIVATFRAQTQEPTPHYHPQQAEDVEVLAGELVNRFSTVYRLPKPNRIVQTVLFALLTPLAYAVGFRPTYRNYLD